ncbi:MAG: hypothetical protein E7K72_22745 [Roseomonas mucosa]|nr:hypothetical protein [Roseomonas mucosa]
MAWTIVPKSHVAAAKPVMGLALATPPNKPNPRIEISLSVGLARLAHIDETRRAVLELCDETYRGRLRLLPKGEEKGGIKITFSSRRFIFRQTVQGWARKAEPSQRVEFMMDAQAARLGKPPAILFDVPDWMHPILDEQRRQRLAEEGGRRRIAA